MSETDTPAGPSAPPAPGDLGSPGGASPRRLLHGIVQGMFIGAADAVPGVSGGTIALLLGIYARLLDALATLLRSPVGVRTSEGRARLMGALRFVVPVGVGLLAAYWVVTRVLVGPTDAPGLLRRAESAPYFLAAFSGLVLAAAVSVWRRIPEPGGRLVALAVIGAAVSAALTGLPQAATEPPVWALLPGGAAAIGVMLLPGVSGSLLLVILGQYSMVSAAVHDRDFGVLAVFLTGVALGAATVVPILRWVLTRWPRPTLALLTGLMVGSLRPLWPWKEQYDAKAGAVVNRLDVLADGGPALLGLVAAALLGAAAVAGLERLEAGWAEAERHEPGEES